MSRPTVWLALSVAALVPVIGLTCDAQAQQKEVLIGVSRLGGPAAAESPDAIFDRAAALIRTGDLSRAQYHLEQLVARYPETAAANRARRELASLYAQVATVPEVQPKPLAPSGMSRLGAGDLPAAAGGWRTSVRPLIGFQRTAQETLRESAGDIVFFSDGSAALGAAARKVLAAQAAWLQQNPNMPIVVEGHADERGTPSELKGLATARAAAVRARLIEEGVGATRIRAVGYGSDRPVALCPDHACGSQNRRAVTVVGGPSTAQLP